MNECVSYSSARQRLFAIMHKAAVKWAIFRRNLISIFFFSFSLSVCTPLVSTFHRHFNRFSVEWHNDKWFHHMSQARDSSMYRSEQQKAKQTHTKNGKSHNYYFIYARFLFVCVGKAARKIVATHHTRRQQHEFSASMKQISLARRRHCAFFLFTPGKLIDIVENVRRGEKRERERERGITICQFSSRQALHAIRDEAGNQFFLHLFCE